MSEASSTASDNGTDTDVGPPLERILVAALFTTWGTISLTIYVVFCCVILATKELRCSPFFRGQLSLAVNDVFAQLAFVTLAAPSNFIGHIYSDLANQIISSIAIDVAWFHSMLLLVFQSLNRYVSICHPHRYDEIFGGRRIWAFIGAAWAVGIALGSVPLFPCCRLLYYPEAYSFSYDESELGATNMSYADATYSLSSLVVVQIINAFTFHNIYKRHRSIHNAGESVFQQRRRNRERVLFLQLFVTTAILLVQETFFIVVPMLSTSRFVGLFASILYLIGSSTTGIVFLFFNETIRAEAIAIVKKLLVKIGCRAPLAPLQPKASQRQAIATSGL